MFFQDLSPKYFAPATYNYLDANGALCVIEFDCEFRRLKRSEVTALDAKQQEVSKTVNSTAGAAALLADVCTNWRIKDASSPTGSKVIPFSLETLAQMEEQHVGFSGACVMAWWQSSTPVQSAHLAAKNA
ncbi:MAG: hypothetical protein AB7P37_03250 [Ramlibacter sp.]